MNDYAWKITKDFHDSDDATNSVSVVGPRHLNKNLFDQSGQLFRMYFDEFPDVEESRALEGYLHGEDADEFAPLDDYGLPAYGCTTIAYWQKEKPQHENLIVEEADGGFFVVL